MWLQVSSQGTENHVGEGGEEGVGLTAWVYTKCSGKGYVGKLCDQIS